VGRVCPSPQKGKEQARHRADLRKKQKIYDYILSSPQENGKTKTKKSSALPVVTSPTSKHNNNKSPKHSSTPHPHSFCPAHNVQHIIFYPSI
jgi:hypothetical protein